MHRFESQIKAGSVNILHGNNIHDLFHVNHKFINLENNLKNYGMRNEVDIYIAVDQNGCINVDGQKGKTQAEEILNSSGREKKYHKIFTKRSNTTKQETNLGNEAAVDEIRAESSREINDMYKIIRVLKNHELNVIVTFSDFSRYITRLKSTQENQMLAGRILDDLKDVFAEVSYNKTIFFTEDSSGYKKLSVELDIANQKYNLIEIPPPSEEEFQALIKKLIYKYGVRADVTQIKSIAKFLLKEESIRRGGNALSKIIKDAGEIKKENFIKLNEVDHKRFNAAKQKLNDMVGFEKGKQFFDKLAEELRKRRREILEGANPADGGTLHMVMYGEAGLGKSRYSRIIAELVCSQGLLENNTVHEITLSQLSSSNIGETSERINELLAKGGVIIIDEAHELGADSHQSNEIVSALIPYLNKKGEIVVILAGYEEIVQTVFQKNKSLDTHFPESRRVRFETPSIENLTQIAIKHIKYKGFKIEEEAEEKLKNLINIRQSMNKIKSPRDSINIGDEVVKIVGDDKLVKKNHIPEPVIIQEDLIRDARQRLDKYIGLPEVKSEVDRILDLAEYHLKFETENGVSVKASDFNSVFHGDPGTGKTSIADIYTQALFGLGVIQNNKLIRVSREDLIGAYQGHTEQAIKDVISRGRDGVIFIDEAYSLKNDDGDSYGTAAVNTLVNQITLKENGGTVFILAGYKKEMTAFINENPGLNRRFPQCLNFSRFNADNCLKLCQMKFDQEGFKAENGVYKKIKVVAEKEIMKANFGNAGWVESYSRRIIDNAKVRIVKSLKQNGNEILDKKLIKICDVKEM